MHSEHIRSSQPACALLTKIIPGGVIDIATSAEPGMEYGRTCGMNRCVPTALLYAGQSNRFSGQPT
jgi:hypothetical protein